MQVWRHGVAWASWAALLLSLPTPTLAAGDPQRGAQAYESRCTGCHSVEQNRVGPRHAGVFGRKAGALRDFDYSPALKAAGFKWDTARLDRWLADPEALVPGQRMGFSVSDPAVRADLVAYLATLTVRK